MNIYGCKRDKMVEWLNTKIMFGKSRVRGIALKTIKCIGRHHNQCHPLP
jgi:hypothetical protein